MLAEHRLSPQIRTAYNSAKPLKRSYSFCLHPDRQRHRAYREVPDLSSSPVQTDSRACHCQDSLCSSHPSRLNNACLLYKTKPQPQIGSCCSRTFTYCKTNCADYDSKDEMLDIETTDWHAKRRFYSSDLWSDRYGLSGS